MNRLEQIEKRLAAATPGPWFYRSIVGDHGRIVTTVDQQTDICETYEHVEHLDNFPNTQLIANAPTDIRDLLAVVKLQREALEAIAGEDFRGNRPNGAVKAFKALEAADKILEGTCTQD